MEVHASVLEKGEEWSFSVEAFTRSRIKFYSTSAI